MLLDTCFLIDLQREFASTREGPARQFLQQRAQQVFAISVVSATEFLEGFEDLKVGEVLLRSLDWLDITPAVAVQAARIRRQLRLAGQLIGDFDILIAATALSTQRALVTRNADHFRRVHGLDVLTY